jgi:hypothetical protein
MTRSPRSRPGLRAGFLLACLLATHAGVAPEGGAEPLDPAALPEPLRPWLAWVRAARPDAGCPFLHGEGTRACAWPGVLAIDADAGGARFAQEWEVAGAGAWVPLPGDRERWPADVRAGERPLAVVPAPGSDAPAVWLPPGRHALAGRLAWAGRPALLAVPPETGLLALRIDGAAPIAPERDPAGRIWLGERPRETAAAPEDALAVQVFRRVEDDVPLALETRLLLRVAGRPREATLGPLHAPGFAPLALDSPLPARLESDGRLRVQLRPGEWTVTVRARAEGGPVAEVAPPTPLLADEEVWVFDARPALRIVAVEGLFPVDPRQTELPDAWRHLPAYVVRSGERMRLDERRRGDPDPADALTLQRTLWLDARGGALTFHDAIGGRLRSGSRLEMAAPGELGRAVVNGHDWFLTRLAEDAPVGVEVPPGTIAIEAEGRVHAARTLPATGWTRGFDEVRARLHLPPGWRIVHAAGADSASPTWLGRWTLLDLFFVLIAAAAGARLWGAAWGAVALVGLALTWHEPGAPRLAWLAVLAAEALVRVLRGPRLAPTARLARLAAWAVLALLALPYLVGELQRGLHPALAAPLGPGADPGSAARAAREAGIEGMPGEPVRELAARVGRAADQVLTRELEPGPGAAIATPAGAPPERATPVPDLRALDPDARIPTGPGLPRWEGTTVELGWSGPVDAGQTLRLWLVSPGANRALAFLRLALVAALVFAAIRLARGAPPPSPAEAAPGAAGAPPPASGPAAATAAALALALAAGLAPPAARAEFPPPELLQELGQRLERPPACHPRCASLARLAVALDGAELRLRLEVHAAAATAVPVPGGAGGWQPVRALAAAGPPPALRRVEGRGWLVVAPGVHDVVLAGPVAPATEQIELPLPLRPALVSVEAPGWSVAGLDAAGRAGDALALRRLAPGGSDAAEPSPGAIEPAPAPFFARVTRTLRLGVAWELETEVVRLSEPGRAALLAVPLVAGEAVASEGVPVEQGRAQVAFAPATRRVAWRSTLVPRDTIELSAPRDGAWVERWRLELQPLWHVEASGPPPVAVPDALTAAPREWRPWPGESLRLAVARPRGAGGATLTIDAATLALRPGARAADAELALELRASQGGRHTITLPEGAELRRVEIDGLEQPLRAEGRALALPLRPGAQTVQLAFRTPAGIAARWAAPQVDLGAAAVNLAVAIEVPPSRWVLWTSGPRQGPAVLFWSLLVVLAVVSAGLARVPGVPLRVHHWFLLGIGLTQVPVWMAGVVAGWLLALAWRGRHGAALPPLGFDAVQLVLAAWSGFALVTLFWAIRQGLLGAPAMQIAGNDSTAYALRWFQDRSDGATPAAGVLSVSLWVYRVAMLAWALWLARALLGWLRWGFESGSAGGTWRPLRAAPRASAGRP